MRKGFDYQGSAADALTLARRATNPSDKVRLLCLAQRWIALADRPPVVALSLRSATFPVIGMRLATLNARYSGTFVLFGCPTTRALVLAS